MQYAGYASSRAEIRPAVEQHAKPAEQFRAQSEECSSPAETTGKLRVGRMSLSKLKLSQTTGINIPVFMKIAIASVTMSSHDLGSI